MCQILLVMVTVRMEINSITNGLIGKINAIDIKTNHSNQMKQFIFSSEKNKSVFGLSLMSMHTLILQGILVVNDRLQFLSIIKDLKLKASHISVLHDTSISLE